MYAKPYGYTPNNDHAGVPLRIAPSQDPLPRATVGEVYEQVLVDLAFAADNLPAENGPYATRLAAEAYLAQVHFLMSDFGEAANYAASVINSGAYTLDEDLDRYETDIINPETIFGIISQPNDFRSSWYRDNLRSDNTANPQLAFSDDFAFFMSLSGAADGRSAWYTPGSRALINRFNEKEYFNVPLAHLTLMHLIRAECLGELNQNLTTAVADLNTIRARAYGIGNNELMGDATAAEVIQAAREEYRKETVCEGMWVEQLLRRGAAGESITIRGASWDCPGMSLQFSNSETTVQGFELNEEGGCL